MSFYNYVLGFAFSEDRKYVLLIHKTHPEWQKGLINGLGGHIQDGESPQRAMMREFDEEAGVRIRPKHWEEFLCITGPDYILHVLRTFDDRIHRQYSMTEERVEIFHIEEIPRPRIVHNLEWMIPMALDRDIAPPVLIALNVERRKDSRHA